MSPETLKALKDSIAHWKENAAAIPSSNVKISASACALCQLFVANLHCAGCPVSERTGQAGCGGTPWVPARDALRLGLFKNFLVFAQAEVEFLESLLPKDEG